MMSQHDTQILDERAAAELAVLVEAGVTCPLCELPVTDPRDAIAIKASEIAPSQLAHRSCEEGMTRLLRQVNQWGEMGVGALRGMGLVTVRSPRD